MKGNSSTPPLSSTSLRRGTNIICEEKRVQFHSQLANSLCQSSLPLVYMTKTKMTFYCDNDKDLKPFYRDLAQLVVEAVTFSSHSLQGQRT